MRIHNDWMDEFDEDREEIQCLERHIRYVSPAEGCPDDDSQESLYALLPKVGNGWGNFA